MSSANNVTFPLRGCVCLVVWLAICRFLFNQSMYVSMHMLNSVEPRGEPWHTFLAIFADFSVLSPWVFIVTGCSIKEVRFTLLASSESSSAPWSVRLETESYADLRSSLATISIDFALLMCRTTAVSVPVPAWNPNWLSLNLYCLLILMDIAGSMAILTWEWRAMSLYAWGCVGSPFFYIGTSIAVDQSFSTYFSWLNFLRNAHNTLLELRQSMFSALKNISPMPVALFRGAILIRLLTSAHHFLPIQCLVCPNQCVLALSIGPSSLQ